MAPSEIAPRVKPSARGTCKVGQTFASRAHQGLRLLARRAAPAALLRRWRNTPADFSQAQGAGAQAAHGALPRARTLVV